MSALAALAFALLAPTGALAATDPGVRASIAAVAPGDQAATQTLLKAEYELAKATLARSPAIVTALTRAAKALGQECRGVLRGAPDESLLEEVGPPTVAPKLSGRAQGERARSEREKQTIDAEIAETISASAYRAVRSPYEAFIATAEHLTWSDPTIDALVHERAARLREDLVGPPIEVCAAMRAWAASAFHVLTTGSRSLEEARETRDKQAVKGNREVLLRPYEDSADRAIVRHIKTLKEQLTEEDRGLVEERFLSAEYHMELALGEKVSNFAAQRFAPVIARGRTSAGTTFVVRRSVARSFGRSCAHEVEVEVRERRDSNSSGVCLGGGASSHPSSSCSGSLETVELVTPPDVRQARVRLSDGRTVTIPVVRVPAKDGGPEGVFVDAFRGHNRYPVSLQELGRDGKVMRTVNLSQARCRKLPASATSGPPKVVNLVTATAPSGEALTIAGILHRVGRHIEFSVELQPGMRNSEVSEEPDHPKQFQWHLSTECAPHPYSLLDGILTPPGASVLVRTPVGLVPLTKVELAPSIPAGGPLFYGVYATPPTEIVVEGSDGSVLYTESLAQKATEETEFCEGYAER